MSEWAWTAIIIAADIVLIGIILLVEMLVYRHQSKQREADFDKEMDFLTHQWPFK